MFRKPILGAFGLLALSATASFAQISIAECNGPKVVVSETDKTPNEFIILYNLNREPKPDENTLMRFESPSGVQVWDWTSEPAPKLNGHCRMQYYGREKPHDGTWAMTTRDVQLEGCPEGANLVPPGLTGTRELVWKSLFTPRIFFKESQIDFDFERINQHHWLATADAMPGLPDTVNITYEFKVPNRKTIDITGTVDLKIEAGSQTVNCKGTVDMVAKYQG